MSQETPKTNVFPYPGSKVQLAPWIIDHFPPHDMYVEPFGGSAAVLVRKPRSDIEVFNDVDSDIVHFFETLRDQTDELVEWLRTTPFSRELHLQYAHEFYRGLRPVDDIERAGRFFYLRNSQFAQNYTEVSGFRLSTERNHADQYQNRVDRLYAFRDRLADVQIEQLDYTDLVGRTDGAETLYYFDPPYVDAGKDLYTGHAGFDHERFVECLDNIDGRWVVSYGHELPKGLREGYWYATQDRRGTLRCGVEDWEKDDTETLVMNFDPDQTPTFTGGAQATFEELNWGDADAE